MRAGYTSGMEPVDYRKIITLEPGKRGGKPCIRGLRITVYDVMDSLASGMTQQEVLGEFPDLTREDLLACFAFAADADRRIARVVDYARDRAETQAAPDATMELIPS